MPCRRNRSAGSRLPLAVPWLTACLALLLAVGASGSRSEPAAPPELAQGAQKLSGPNREADLLRKACVYLKLTRAQLTHLLFLARQTDPPLERFLEEEARALRALDRLPEQDPQAQARAREALDGRRQQVYGQIVRYAGPSFIRMLTREQVGLAWRLVEGNPPKYAGADPALVDPAAGFARAASPRGLSLQNEELYQLRLRAEAQHEVAAAELERANAALAAEATAAAVESLRLQELESTTLRSGAVEVQTGESRPFAQRLAESSDPGEFWSGVEPLARRLFTSPMLLPVLREALTRGLPGATARSPLRPGTLRLIRDYRIERGLGDRTGRGPLLEGLGGRVERGQYLFGPGQGLRLADTGVTDHYAVELIFRFAGGTGYQKLIDFKNGREDGGLYLYQGHVTFYTLADGGVPQPGRDHRLRLERDRTTRIARAYLDWRPIFAFVDLDDAAVFEKGAGLLFVDDQSTRNEQGPGALYSLTVWGTPSRG